VAKHVMGAECFVEFSEFIAIFVYSSGDQLKLSSFVHPSFFHCIQKFRCYLFWLDVFPTMRREFFSATVFTTPWIGLC